MWVQGPVLDWEKVRQDRNRTLIPSLDHPPFTDLPKVPPPVSLLGLLSPPPFSSTQPPFPIHGLGTPELESYHENSSPLDDEERRSGLP